jgi:beta-1,4-glucosyltransferase
VEIYKIQNKNFITLAGFSILETSPYDLVQTILIRMDKDKKSLLFFANTNFIVQCQPILSLMNSPNILIVNDGVGMDLASYLIYQRKFKANLNGTDFIPFFFKNANKVLRIFLVGGVPNSISKAAHYFEHHLGQVVVGTCDGYEGIKNFNLVNEINGLKVDVILVAMGNPKQEKWILDNYTKLNANFIVGVGALFDFLAGDKSRAPHVIRQMRLEWLYRLCLEPKRLMKRYTIDIIRFLLICLRYKSPRN